jgi:hypothetical protein
MAGLGAEGGAASDALARMKHRTVREITAFIALSLPGIRWVAKRRLRVRRLYAESFLRVVDYAPGQGLPNPGDLPTTLSGVFATIAVIAGDLRCASR